MILAKIIKKHQKSRFKAWKIPHDFPGFEISLVGFRRGADDTGSVSIILLLFYCYSIVILWNIMVI
jgi:hypothetical protein